jgi:hypothetical protein
VVAKAQVLYGPWQFRLGRRKRQNLAHYLKFLASALIAIDHIRLCFKDHFAARRGLTQSVSLCRFHCFILSGSAAACCAGSVVDI